MIRGPIIVSKVDFYSISNDEYERWIVKSWNFDMMRDE